MSGSKVALESIVSKMSKQGVVPVLRADSAEDALDKAERLLEHGISVVELTTTIPQWHVVLKQLVTSYPDATLGMGTLADYEDARRACDHGAEFLVSPYPAEGVRKAGDRSGTPFIGGGFTPGEIAVSADHGAAKLFPAHIGGLTYLSTLKSVLPNANIMPTGGIKSIDVPQWLQAGAFAVGVGRDLYAATNLKEKLHRLSEMRQS